MEFLVERVFLKCWQSSFIVRAFSSTRLYHDSDDRGLGI